MLPEHKIFKPLTLFFCLFVFLQFLSGVFLYGVKIGFHPADTLEFYVGSEEMLKVYPGRADRFKRGRSLPGMVKFALGHIAAFALICFILTHLLRSLRALQPTSLYRIDRFADALFLLALLDILAGFLVVYGPPWTVYVRLFVFLVFVVLGFAGSLMLAYFALAGRR